MTTQGPITQTHATDNLEIPIRLQCMQQLEYLEETPEAWRELLNSTNRVKAGTEPPTLEVWNKPTKH